jgi:uncharacterized membrane protein YhfC
MPTLNLSSLPVDQQKQIVDQFAAIAARTGWLPVLGANERLCAITFQIAMSVVVLQVFHRGQIRWLWIAVFAHYACDFAAVGVAQGLLLLRVTSGAILALWTILALCATPSAESQVLPPQTATA